YKTAPINYANADFKSLIGQPDTCHIYVALADWTAPFEIRTNPRNQQLFDKNSPSIIAYGELVYSGTMDEYQPFEIRLEYRSTSRVPTYLQITCAASKLGDYFTGGAGAVLYVDQFSFDYDY
ncbi:MAG: PCMD domain-containing protein, partial [Muribaculaceae bacterium]|nr:PCMD domain-containing protein [Muribaculaceae bacterium]